MTSQKNMPNTPPDPKGYVCIGQFSASHGVKGDIRLKAFTEKTETLKKFKTLYLGNELKTINLTFLKSEKSGFVVSVPGFESPETVKTLKGEKVYVSRDELTPLNDPDEYYHADLVGMDVKTKSGVRLGQVSGVHDFGAGEIIEIALKTPKKGLGTNLLIPFRGNVVTAINIKKGNMVIDPTGWLEEDGK